MKKLYLISTIITVFILFFTSAPTAASVVTEMDDLLEKGKFAVDFSNEWIRYRNGESESFFSTYGYYGITNNMEFCFGRFAGLYNYPGKPSFSTPGNVYLGLKYRMIEQVEKRPSFGVLVFSNFQAGRSSEENQTSEYGAYFFATQRNDKTAFHANLGYTFTGGTLRFTGDNPYTYSIAAEKFLGKKWTAAAEFHGESSAYSSPLATMRVGVSYDISPSVSISAGYGLGLNDKTPSSSIITGVSLSF
jgi:hypothetical protein